MLRCRPTCGLLVCLSLCLAAREARGTPCEAAPGQPPSSGIVWLLEGEWIAKGAKKPLTVFQGVTDVSRLEPLTHAMASRIMVLLNGGHFHVRTCPLNGSCVIDCRPAQAHAASMNIARFSSIREESGHPRYRSAMARASGWQDAVIAIAGDGSIDLAPVFRGTRPRAIAFRLCPVDPAEACDSEPIRVEWNGATARGAAPDARAGLVKIVEDDNGADAWIRLVSADRAAAVEAEYRAALDIIQRWTLPESDTPLPSLDRLRRMALASVAEERR